MAALSAQFHTLVRSEAKVQECDTLVWSDPGADADDEIALREGLRAGISFTLCIGGRGKLSHWQAFHRKDRDVGTPDHEYDNGEFPPFKLRPKNILLIAPGIDKHLEHFDFTALEHVFYQGNLPVNKPGGFQLEEHIPDESAAFNDNGSGNFFSRLGARVVVRAITTAESLKTPFSEDLFDSIELPESQREIVRANTFNQLLGRMNPQHAYNQFAEGLINPEIKGGNYKMARQLLGDKEIPPASVELNSACDDYMKKLGAKATSPIETAGYLKVLSRMVAAIAGFEPIAEDGTLIVSGEPDGTPFTLHEKYAEQYANFKETVKSYTPAFDLVAMQALIDYQKSKHN